MYRIDFLFLSSFCFPAPYLVLSPLAALTPIATLREWKGIRRVSGNEGNSHQKISYIFNNPLSYGAFLLHPNRFYYWYTFYLMIYFLSWRLRVNDVGFLSTSVADRMGTEWERVTDGTRRHGGALRLTAALWWLSSFLSHFTTDVGSVERKKRSGKQMKSEPTSVVRQ